MGNSLASTRTHTIRLGGRRLEYAAYAIGAPRIDIYGSDQLRVRWRDRAGLEREYTLGPHQDLVVARVDRTVYVFGVLSYGDGNGGRGVMCKSSTRPWMTRMRGSAWHRMDYGDPVYGTRPVAYVHTTGGITVEEMGGD